ncbi:MAG TPA: response regulator [Chloroflexota bacterium]
MSTDKIRVLVVDDFADTRDSITKLLYFEHDMEVVGTASDAKGGIRMASELRPDIILMDINMPGMDGIAATEAINAENAGSDVIMMSVQGEPDYLRRAMLAGAREYLIKPFTSEELAGSIRHVYEAGMEKRARIAAMQQPVVVAAPQPAPTQTGRMISVFSPKGGVGRTTVAVNVAIAMRALTGKRVALVDCSLLFGDIGIMLNLPASKTISDLVPNASNLDVDYLEGVMADHSSGIRVLLAPSRPELAELVHAEHLRKILTLMKSCYDYVVVDTHSSFDDSILSVLDLSERILLLTTLEMPAIKNVKLFLEVAEALHYSQDKLMLVLNRADSTGGIQVEDIEESIRFKVAANIVSAGQVMAAAVNQGVPVTISNSDSQVAADLFGLASKCLTETDAAEARQKAAPAPAKAREGRGGFGLGKYRLLTYASKKGSN